MWVRVMAVVLAVLMAQLLLIAHPQHPKPIVGEGSRAALAALETEVARNPADAAATLALGKAYIEAKTPGSAAALIKSAPATVRDSLASQHLLALALFEMGHAEEGLRVETPVLEACKKGDCEEWLAREAAQRHAALFKMAGHGDGEMRPVLVKP